MSDSKHSEVSTTDIYITSLCSLRSFYHILDIDGRWKPRKGYGSCLHPIVQVSSDRILGPDRTEVFCVLGTDMVAQPQQRLDFFFSYGLEVNDVTLSVDDRYRKRFHQCDCLLDCSIIIKSNCDTSNIK